VSAKNGDGISDLLDMILLQADMMELRADPECMAQGVVIESRLSRKKGPIATVLIKSGTLRVGDSFVIDAGMGKVRALLNDVGEKVTEAGPGMPVEVLGLEDVVVSVIHAATGPVNENDIMLARASNAVIIGFGVSINAEAQRLADAQAVEIKMYQIIYQIVDDLTKAVHGLLKPEFEEIEVGRADVRQLFRFSKVGVIAGSYVTSGKLIRTATVKVLRQNKEVFAGKFQSLKRFQDDVKEVATGFECGIVVEGFESLQEGDVIVAMVTQEKKR